MTSRDGSTENLGELAPSARACCPRGCHDGNDNNSENAIGLDNGRGLSSVWKDLEQRRQIHGPMQSRKAKYSILLGQIVALVAASMNAASFTLEYGMNKVFPMFLMFHSYLVLSFHLLWNNKTVLHEETHYKMLCIKLRCPWYYYLGLSILDVGPNYLSLMALNRTSLTSATLLGSLTIPSTMFFCRILLVKAYGPMHFVGVTLCIAAGLLTLKMDKDDSSTDHPDSFSGDILCVLAALGYGIGDAAAEFWSKHVDRVEYLGMIGIGGMFWCLIIVPIFEREAVLDLFTDRQSFLPVLLVILWYIASLVGYYVFESIFLKKSDATLLNLSLQTSNFWAVIFSIVVFQEKPGPQFYVAVSMVIAGVICYELCGNSPSHPEEARMELLPTTSQSPPSVFTDGYKSIEKTNG